MILKKLLIALLALVIACALMGCDQSGSSGSGGAVGTVNDVALDGNAYQQRVQLVTNNYESQYGIDLSSAEYAEMLTSIQDMCFDYMVEEVLLQQEAERQGVTVDQAQVDAQLEYIKTQTNVGGADGYQLYLNQLGVDEAFLLSELSNSALYDQITQPLVADVAVTEDEVRAYYQKQDGGVEIYHILIADQAAAQGVLDRVKAGEDFAALAQEFGTDATASSGGYLGVGNAQSTWVEAFKTAALSLGPNEIYPELVQSEFGYHIIKSGAQTGTEEAFQADYTTLESEALSVKKNEVLTAWMDELKANANIVDQRSK